jgi:Recombination endonuclease VII
MRHYYAARRDGTWRRKAAFDRLLRLYGISAKRYEELLEHQGRVCALCGGTNVDSRHRGKALCVDHDHKTGVIRGLLCHRCNRLLGLAADDPARLVRAARYLLHARHKSRLSSVLPIPR